MALPDPLFIYREISIRYGGEVGQARKKTGSVNHPKITPKPIEDLIIHMRKTYHFGSEERMLRLSLTGYDVSNYYRTKSIQLLLVLELRSAGKYCEVHYLSGIYGSGAPGLIGVFSFNEAMCSPN